MILNPRVERWSGGAEEVKCQGQRSHDKVNHHHHHVLHVGHLGHILHVPRVGHIAQYYWFYLSYITGLMQLEGKKLGYKLLYLF